MTKDELKKEATEYALEWGDKTDGTYACCRDGYLAGAEPREKRIAELEKENTELKEELERNCTPEKIKAIKEKYKNGVTEEILKEMFLLEIK